MDLRVLIYILFSAFLVSLISFIGILFFFNKKTKKINLKYWISLSAGALLGISFLDLLPEAIDNEFFAPKEILIFTLVSIIFFFIIEQAIHWHHCQCEDNCDNHKKYHLAVNNLIGDFFHNAIDGFVIASSFMLDVKLGFSVVLGIILHEIPQEISDFGVLIYSGLKRKTALLYNFLIALSSVIGGILFFLFFYKIDWIIPIMAAIAAGNFIYLSIADLLPELHKHKDQFNLIKTNIFLFLGILIIFVLQFVM